MPVRFYKLEGRHPRPIAISDIPKYDDFGKQVAETILPGYRVSTFFLGMGHGGCLSRPVLFETVVFFNDSTGHDVAGRCSTYSEAEEMHRKTVERLAKLAEAV